MSDGPLDAVVTGGGTAGHVLPAIAIAEALVAAGHPAERILYVGAERGIETRLLPATPFAAEYLDVVGVQRRLDRSNLSFGPKLWRARARMIERFRDRRPRVVVSVGGYASLPAVLAARRLRVPIVVVSYDRRPGRASQLAARWAAACAVAFPGSPLPRATLTGAPVRADVLAVDRDRDRVAARRELGVDDDRFLVVVTGGSQGSGVLNAAIRDWVDEHADDRGLAVRHVVGERFLTEAAAPTDGSGGVRYEPVGFEHRMPLLYAAADVLVGRGGASTVHEVAVTGVPAVLVPWAGAAEDHQTANVEWLAEAGAARLLPESAVGDLGRVLDELRADPAGRAAMSAAARELGMVHRSGALAALVESVALA
ncbi:MAG: UDP-N-acetylglucosamine--N-acetylmuramyl-(pentapeptide) pyrophosphoryl-undecaprenol N-acetylglucosamine transferase [Ilumatobacteraceae bacterium]|jgi:UDP-N-acetylglucosamine:LPS N-acetylglucosamine transferase|nr:UDP-N-acetylglucosamine--N-acetylmuramyl-(pentapeptide) pyrophosphoryl-undecaprenol N-acetylglucosamine transferase [Ilumatobacteraceae bacterium]